MCNSIVKKVCMKLQLSASSEAVSTVITMVQTSLHLLRFSGVGTIQRQPLCHRELFVERPSTLFHGQFHHIPPMCANHRQEIYPTSLIKFNVFCRVGISCKFH